MASSTPTTKDIANAWGSFYSRYQRLLGGGRGQRTRIEAARKEWSTILNNLRGGMFRHWPTEPNEIRQIQELLHWKQCDMWGAIDGTTRISAHHHTRTTTSHSYTSFQGWESEVKGLWNDQDTTGANTQFSKIQIHEAKTNTGGGEHELGLSHAFLVPFATLYEELNGTLDSEERKHFAVMKSLERQGEFYSMAQEYTANVQNEFKEVQGDAESKELYKRYASSLLILATKSYDEWTKDVLDWKPEPAGDEEGVSDDNASDEEEETETNTQTNLLGAARDVEIAKIITDISEAAHLHSVSGAEIRDEGGTHPNLVPRNATQSSYTLVNAVDRHPQQRQLPRERKPKHPGATHVIERQLELESGPVEEYGNVWPSGVSRSVYNPKPSTQSLNSMAQYQSRSQHESTSYAQISRRDRNQNQRFANVGTNVGLQRGSLESTFERPHTQGTPKPVMDDMSLPAKENLHPARAKPYFSDDEKLQPPASLPLPRIGNLSIDNGTHFSNSMYRAGPVPFPGVDDRGETSERPRYTSDEKGKGRLQSPGVSLPLPCVETFSTGNNTPFLTSVHRAGSDPSPEVEDREETFERPHSQTPKPPIGAKLLPSKKNLQRGRAYPSLSDEERERRLRIPVPLPLPSADTFPMGNRTPSSNSMYRAVPLFEVGDHEENLRTFPSATPVSLYAVSSSQPNWTSSSRQTQRSQTPGPPSPRQVYIHDPSSQAPCRNETQGPSMEKSPIFQHAILMEEGRAGYASQSYVHNEGVEVKGGSAEGLPVDIHDIESISDISSISESEGEESKASTPSSTPIAINYVPEPDLQPPSISRMPSGILRGAGARTGIRRERSVQFRNSPEVRYIR